MDPWDPELTTKLLNGCCREAEHCDRTASRLEGLCRSLAESFQPHLASFIREMINTARNLRELVDLAQVHISRVPVVTDHINVILPCLVMTLQDIKRFYDDRSMNKEQRWRRMYHDLSIQLSGTTLPARFILYNQYLQQLQLLISKSQSFDLNGLQSFRNRTLELREAMGIGPPSALTQATLMWYDTMEYWNEPMHVHWAQALFSRPLATKTKLKNRKHKRSEAFGFHKGVGQIDIPPDSKIILKRSFEDDLLSVTFLLQQPYDAPYLLIRTAENDEPMTSMRGAHELCISRHDESVVNITRWSKRNNCKALWASLVFTTLEELVLFYYTFVSLKARSVLLVDIHPREFILRKETKHFQAQIIDDGFNHSLGIYKDTYTGRHRLHASVWDADLKDFPVWTAFLPGHLAEKNLIRHKSPHRVWIRGIQPFVFCEKYSAKKQQRGNNEFELDFVHERAATHFVDFFGAGNDKSQGEAGPSGRG